MNDFMDKHTRHKEIKRQGIILAVIGAGMLAMAFGFVPMYRTFCQIIGIPVPQLGTEMTPQKSSAKSTPIGAENRHITVRFIGNPSAGVPIEFGPRVKTIIATVGEPVLTAYDAKNTVNQDIKGQAVHTIVAMGDAVGRDAAKYVELVQCFCFEEQLYPGNTEVTLPLSFTIRQDLPKGVHTLTFAYTLFEMDDN